MDVDFDADSLSVDEEQSSGPPLKKKKTAGKWRGAAIYKTKFNHSWQMFAHGTPLESSQFS